VYSFNIPSKSSSLCAFRITDQDLDFIACVRDRLRPTKYDRRAVLNAAFAASTPFGMISGRLWEQLTAAAANPPVHGPITKVLVGDGYDLEPEP
jgi:hypothetical protein